MYKNILVLDDGTEISAGKVGHNAIRALTCTETVSSTTDLCPGAACASKLEITIWVEPGGDLVITSGTRLVHYREEASGTRTRCGTYWAVKPTRQTRNTYKIYAYDAVSRLDGIQSTWLRSIQGQFPMTLWAFAQLVARRCGVEIANDTLPRNGDYQVQAFYADDLTGRQLLSWVAQASCTFLRSMPDGKIGFDWYTDHARSRIGPGSGSAWTALDLSGQLLATADGEVWTFAQPQAGYFSGTLSYEDYTTAPIDKVQIRQSDDDVGVLYPADETGTNALVIQGNLLLTTQTADALRPVAQAIYETMQGVTYTPMRVEIPYTSDAPSPGEIITVTDAYGRQMQTYIMSRTISGKRVTLESTGNARRDSTAAVNEQKFTNLQGKVLEISANVEGFKVTAKDLQNGMAELNVAVDRISTEVSGKLDGKDAQTLIDQNLKSLTLSATAGNQSSRLVLKAGSAELASAEITFNGLVNFVSKSDLSTAGRTAINGGNITTGRVGNADGNTVYDLDAGTLRTGRSGSTRVEINDTGIRWYYQNYLTGVLYSQYGKNYIGSNSRYSFFGWFSNGTPSFGYSSGGATGSFVGLAVDQVSATIHCNASKFEIPGRIECSSLSVNGREI
ncbi:MAG: hypothetical protein SPH42_09040 [Gemmiger sp.]|uniref:hypothetical protein n=1 Tax=Gemmiger sp. TaxID=2049027 RepID=UPI002A91AC65|nr:hypothetical protein [Gemmiger sp.]MDY5326971.1 hypothetical protein [Gemmiger sp.]